MTEGHSDFFEGIGNGSFGPIFDDVSSVPINGEDVLANESQNLRLSIDILINM